MSRLLPADGHARPGGRPAPRAARAAWASVAVAGMLLAAASPAAAQGDPASPPTTAAATPATTAAAATASTAATAASTATTNAPATAATFPAPLVGVVPEAAAELPPEQDITGVYRGEGADPGVAELVVQFDRSFDRPAAGYRLAVVVGDPAGERLAVTLTTPPGTEAQAGELVRHDGSRWRGEGPADVHLDASGFALISLPLDRLPAGRGLWVEVGGDADAPARRSPYFARDALLGTGPAGVLPGTDLARLDPAPAGGSDVVALPDVPMATVHERLLVVGAGGPPPETLVGQAVTKVEDRIRLAPDYNRGATRTAEVRVDWAKGQVSLFDRSNPPVDRSGDRTWRRLRYPAEGSLHPDAVELDLAGLAGVLGDSYDPARLAVGVTRVVTLADGRTVRAEGVMATVEWFTRTPVVAESTPAPDADAVPAGEPGTDDSFDLGREAQALLDRLRTYDERAVAGGAAGIAVVLALLLLLARRRRKRKEARRAAEAEADARRLAEQPLPWDRADGQLTHEAEQRVMAEVLASMPAEEADGHVLGEEPVGRSRRARRRARREARRTRKVLDLDALEAWTPPTSDEPSPLDRPVARNGSAAAGNGSTVGGSGSVGNRRVGPTDALAALDGDLLELRAHLEDLGPR